MFSLTNAGVTWHNSAISAANASTTDICMYDQRLRERTEIEPSGEIPLYNAYN